MGPTVIKVVYIPNENGRKDGLYLEMVGLYIKCTVS